MDIIVATFSYRDDPAALARLRPARHDFFRALDREGSLLASGQLLDGELGEGMLVLRADGPGHARRLLDEDPYALAGLVARLDLARWHPTMGAWVHR